MRDVGRGPEGRRMKAFLIAAGLASRLRPMTDSTPAQAGMAASSMVWQTASHEPLRGDHLRGAGTALKGA